ncbi:MAG: FKBP-type peptidyl-prolyl cis-trans isomerase [Candidatus Pacearchaeota archaeon]|jgi:FKBP-type peptidyl-prolyl cis-trans isomerase 2
MALQKKDFIEIEFTAKTKDGQIFDTNIAEDLRESNLQGEAKPFVYCIGEDMFLKSVDEFLIGKEIGKYKIELQSEKAFGKRQSSLVQIIPAKAFYEQKINPIPGLALNFDGRIGKILTVSGGRVIVDFNHFLAGKDVIYEIKIIKKIENLNEKIKAVNDFLFRKDFKFSVDGKTLELETEKGFGRIAELFKDKYKSILDLDLKVKEIEKEESLKDKEKLTV